MDFDNLFKTGGVILLMIIAYFAIIGGWNNIYGTTVGSNSATTYDRIQVITNATLFNTSIQATNATIIGSGAGPISATIDLANRALRIITLLPQLPGLFESILLDGANLLGIPPTYVYISIYSVYFLCASLILYLLITGARRLL